MSRNTTHVDIDALQRCNNTYEVGTLVVDQSLLLLDTIHRVLEKGGGEK